jgi:hypothetical protein
MYLERTENYTIGNDSTYIHVPVPHTIFFDKKSWNKLIRLLKGPPKANKKLRQLLSMKWGDE